MTATISNYRAMVPSDADLTHILPDLRDKAVPIDVLSFDSANVNVHDVDSIRVITGSLGQFEQHRPLVANLRKGKPVVIIGNGVLESVRNLGWKYVAVIFTDEDHVKATGRAIADNRTSQFSHFDNDSLHAMLIALQQEGMPIEKFGFGPSEMEELEQLVKGSGDDDLHVPDGEPQEDVSNAAQTVVIEIHIPPELAEEVIPKLKEVSRLYEARGLAFNVA